MIERRPRLGERVIVSTTPYAFKGFIGYRNFTLTTEGGEILAKAASIWTLVDIEKMRPARPSEEILAGYEIGPKLEMEYEPRRIDLTGEGTPREPFFIRQNQIDSNHHVNNEEYVNMAMEYLNESWHVTQVRAEYKKPAYLHDTLIPVIYEQGNRMQVQLTNEQHETLCIVEFTHE